MKQLRLWTETVTLSIVLTALMLASSVGAPLRAAAQTTPVPMGVTLATEIPLAPGERSTLPAVTSGPNDLILIGTADPPLLSALDAQNILADTGIYWALSGNFVDGTPVTITAIHGLATSGFAVDPTKIGNTGPGGCVGWLGPCNYPVYRCMNRTQPGSMCMPTGEIIPRFENRPSWVIDIGGASFVGSRTSVNHSVYLIDEMTASSTFIWGYQGP